MERPARQDHGGAKSQGEGGHGALVPDWTVRLSSFLDRIGRPGQDPDAARNKRPEGGQIEGEEPQGWQETGSS